MNLIERHSDLTNESILNYRQNQYSYIIDFAKNCINYLTKFGFDDTDLIYELRKNIKYKSNKHFSLLTLKIFKKSDQKDEILILDIPELLYDVYFKLGGVYYIPLLYIIDEPIILKKNSIKLSSMFKSITIFYKESRVIFSNTNIPISRFFRLFADKESTVKNICEIYEANYFLESKERSIKLVSTDILGFPYEGNFPLFLNEMFFDSWTKELYSKYYNVEQPTLEKILINATKRKIENISPSFNDLKYKRIVFLELILAPLIKTISMLSVELSKGKNPENLKIRSGSIVDHFYASVDSKMKGLSGNNIYNIVNGYSSIVSLKASFKTPKGISELPKGVHDVHESHKNIACPITISNSDPGVTISFLPNIKLDSKFGILYVDKH